MSGTKRTMKEIEELLFENDKPTNELLTELALDERKGVQTMLKRYKKQLEKEQELLHMHSEMTQFEQALYKQNHQWIAGVDEVGRGPLAGPVVAAAVILPQDFQLLGLTDSKKLTKAKREEFDVIIKREAIAYSITMIDATEIDQINIYEATKKAMLESILSLTTKPTYLLLDAMKLEIDIEQQSLVKGDSRSLSIAASSVIAKVARDHYMTKLHQEYPTYHFNNNMGYGTAGHLEAIKEHGIIHEHRKSFKPVIELAGKDRSSQTTLS
ncbi:ribonuclease HII [Alkalihalobacillus pseudalcaliphilus]|uniref:ribonuclease HII n=1 Tax=Alkalihalobacillus pseudalcaliphilus TaxID=79884 RepID=UPI00064DD2D9|nr:ribonuclease HII [Alkalihalobacillus pseudalcaliphilus]KMK77192.1 ribonuclease H [Alkalihalobacillus pseudalcaliphilus]